MAASADRLRAPGHQPYRQGHADLALDRLGGHDRAGHAAGRRPPLVQEPAVLGLDDALGGVGLESHQAQEPSRWKHGTTL